MREGIEKEKYNLITIREFADFHTIPVRELKDVIFGKLYYKKGPAVADPLKWSFLLRKYDPEIALVRQLSLNKLSCLPLKICKA